MKHLTTKLLLCAVAVAAIVQLPDSAQAADEELKIGNIRLKAPEVWEAKEPKFKGIVAYEFAIPAEKGDKQNGRVTLGRLGGTVDANVDRWLRSFRQPDGKPTKERAKVEKKEIAGHDVHVVDVSGTYTAPPFAGGGTHENYRLLGAFIITGDGAAYIKCMGPRKTMAANEKAFEGLISSLKVD